tara:strand:+ start:389 stop:1240 length:852 start_codon:yes stop_codon:yes gene_type:complete
MNTILFLDGSDTSIYLLNLIKKNKHFVVKKIIVSPNIKNIKKFKHKNIIKTDFKKKLNLGYFDIGFSYYDFKIPKSILDKIKIGGINFHPSFLPFNRGRHSAFWGIVKNTKLGASAHWLNSNLDMGDIFYQKQLDDNEASSAKEIYFKQLKLLKKVMIKTIDLIKEGILYRIKQNHKIATYHYAGDIKNYISFNINNKINNLKLARLIRGTTFSKKTGIYILDKNSKYLINSNFKIKKYIKNKNYNLKFKKIFGNLYHKKKINFEILLNNKKMKINSNVYLID